MSCPRAGNIAEQEGAFLVRVSMDEIWPSINHLFFLTLIIESVRPDVDQGHREAFAAYVNTSLTNLEAVSFVLVPFIH